MLAGVRRPAALGFETDEVRRAITVAPPKTMQAPAAAQTPAVRSDWAQPHEEG